jgi:hypothetical protein
MPRLALVAAALAATLVVGGCSKEEMIKGVKDTTTKICGFVPTVATIDKLLVAFGVSSATGVVEVAQQICNTVTRKSAQRGGARPVLKGVRIEGRFVR